MNPVINRDIQVDTVSSKQASTGNMKWIITDTNKLKYFFWQNNKGEPSAAYLSFTGMGVKKGDVINIGFTESEESFVNKEKQTVNYTDRFILGLREGQGQITPPPAQTGRGEAPNASQGASSDAFGRRLGIQGHINALLSNPNMVTGPADDFKKIETIVGLAIAIEDEAEKQLNPSKFRQAVEKHAPNVVIPPEDEPIISDEDIANIPF